MPSGACTLKETADLVAVSLGDQGADLDVVAGAVLDVKAGQLFTPQRDDCITDSVPHPNPPLIAPSTRYEEGVVASRLV